MSKIHLSLCVHLLVLMVTVFGRVKCRTVILSWIFCLSSRPSRCTQSWTLKVINRRQSSVYCWQHLWTIDVWWQFFKVQSLGKWDASRVHTTTTDAVIGGVENTAPEWNGGNRGRRKSVKSKDLKMYLRLFWQKIVLWYWLVERSVWIWNATFEMRQGHWLERYCCTKVMG